MKIFNWVHRKFNHKAENAKRNGDAAAGDEKKLPPEDECDDVFERWRGGILAIGTFGFDPLKDKNEELITHDYFLEDDGDHSSVKDDDRGDGEGNPLVLAIHDCNAGELTETETETEENDEMLQFGFEYVMMEKKERVTLADLFTADPGDQDPRAAAAAIAKNRTFNQSDLLREKSSRKHALSFTAKNAHRPIHKLNKLMRRMLRRKIHPEVGPINSKVAALNNYNYDYDYDYNYNYNYNDKCRGATDDYASLLPIQGTNM